MAKKFVPVPTMSLRTLEKQIYFIRNEKVMLDSDLAALYGITTFNLNKAVSRNLNRFPTDFIFRLTKEETFMTFQFGIPKVGRGGRRNFPYVFTEQGVAMLSSVLKSKRAVQVNIEIMRAFVRLREILGTHADLARKLDELESKYDEQFSMVFQAIRELMTPPKEESKREMGFRTED